MAVFFIYKEKKVTGKTHTLGGAMAGLAVATMNESTGLYLGAVLMAGVAGGLFVDIDTTESKIGYKLRPLAVGISKLTRHRGFCHTMPFIFLSTALLGALLLAAMLLGYQG